MGTSGMLDKIFPPKYDFYEMLEAQAGANAEAIAALTDWLAHGGSAHADRLLEICARAEAIRKDMEKKLVEAFTTPFDRGDLYYISVTMAKALEYARSTMESMQVFQVAPDSYVTSMGERLKSGAEVFSKAVAFLKNAPEKSEQQIPALRAAHADTERLYREGMQAAFSSGDAMGALRHREIYHHVKDASKYLSNAVDILHRIIVRLT